MWSGPVLHHITQHRVTAFNGSNDVYTLIYTAKCPHGHYSRVSIAIL